MNMNIKPLQNELKTLYKEFESFCNKNGIRLYLAYGTLLGAIRHKGFIPWDDDWDVYMPRPDYEKMIQLRHCLPEDMTWSSIETNPDHDLLFGKIYKKVSADDIARLERETGLSIRQGIFIDIFPLDGMPSNPISLLYWRAKRSYLRRHASGEELQRWFKSYSYDKCRYVGAANCEQSSPSRYRYLKSDFAEPKTVPFDDIQVLVPSQPESVLSVEFGDWRKLPPEDQCKPSHQVVA